jgi:hypothetical protein
VDGCEVCSDRRKAVVSPLALLGAAPFVPAPPFLRERVLADVDTGSAVPISFTSAGFAGPSAGPGPRRAGGWLVRAVAAVALLVVGALALQLTDDDDTTELTAAGGSTTTATPDADDEPGVSPATGASTTSTAGPTTTTSGPGVAAPPPEGPAGPPATDEPALTPPGTAPPTTAPPVTSPPTTDPPPTTTAPTTTTAPPDRSAPVVSALGRSASEINTQSCNGGLPKTVTITATITDSSAVTAILYWSGPAGNGQVTMSASGSTYSGTFGGFAYGGRETYYVIATDAAGNATESASGTVDVLPCPQ